MTHFCVIIKSDFMTQNGAFKMGETIGYIRVSTEEQNIARQETALKEKGCTRLYIDKLSGKDRNRPELEAMLGYVREGDTVIVESISRLARSTRDLLDIIQQLDDKKVTFVSLKETIDTDSPTGKFMLTVFAAISELERDYIKQRQAEGIAEAKKRGVYFGRPSIDIDQTEFEGLIDRWERGEIKQAYICKKLGISRSTLARKLAAIKNKENQGGVGKGVGKPK